MATTSNTITATAGQTEFSFSFPYLKKESIKVTIDTVATTAFTIPDNNPTTVVLNSGATAGQVIVISRITSTTATPATFFSGGAIRSQDLNNNFDSMLYITQEKENQLTEVIAGGIADGSITSSKLANQSVGTAALIDGGVATVDLADNAVTTDKILNNAVTTDKILNNAVTTDKILNNAVTTAKVIDAAVTPVKLDRAYVETTGDTMTGALIVPSLSSPSGNLPIQRASVADSQVQSFSVQDDDHTNWYPFNPIPTWCNHVRYDLSVSLSTNTTALGGLYLRWGSASGPLLQNQVSSSGPNTSTLQNGPGTITYADPLILVGLPSEALYYDYVMDYYFYNREIGGGSDFYCYGIGNGVQIGNTTVSVSISNARMCVQHIIPQAPNTIQADRMGVLFFGGTASGNLNTATVKQTFMTDGPVGFPADIGTTPTPI